MELLENSKVAAVDYNDATEQRILALKEAAKLAHADATAARTERDKAVGDAQADKRKMQQEKDRCVPVYLPSQSPPPPLSLTPRLAWLCGAACVHSTPTH
jgi:hypothetical protein